MWRCGCGFDLADAGACERCGQRGPAAPSGLDEVKLDPTNQATQLVEIARDIYRVFRATDGRTYAVERNGPNIAVSVGRQGRFATRLSRTFIEAQGKAPGGAAIDGAVRILDAYADDRPPEEVHLRIARSGPGVVLDLAGPDGRCVIITAGGWRIADRSPVLFRRGKTLPLADPVSDGTGLDKLRALLNAREDQFRLIVAWAVAALVPDRPYTILYLRGEQGSAKSTAARIIQGTVDPGASGPGSFPKDERDYAVRMHAAHIHAFDNLSAIQQWQSDILCRTATGDTFTTRELYSDDNLMVTSYRRPIILTAIDVGAMNGDLVERLLPVDLHKIERENRRIERATLGSNERENPGILDEFSGSQPYILGALLDLLTSVLANASSARPESLPRMADFAVILAALDKAQGWSVLGRYRELSDQALRDVLENDRFAAELLKFMELRDEWHGTATVLRDQLTMQLPERERDRPPRSWPPDATRTGARLRRLAPSLRVYGIEADQDREGNKRTRVWSFRKIASAASAASADGSELGKRADAAADATAPADASWTAAADTSVRTVSPGQGANADAADAADADSRRLHIPHEPPLPSVAGNGYDDDESWVREPPDDYDTPGGGSQRLLSCLCRICGRAVFSPDGKKDRHDPGDPECRPSPAVMAQRRKGPQ